MLTQYLFMAHNLALWGKPNVDKYIQIELIFCKNGQLGYCMELKDLIKLLT